MPILTAVSGSEGVPPSACWCVTWASQTDVTLLSWTEDTAVAGGTVAGTDGAWTVVSASVSVVWVCWSASDGARSAGFAVVVVDYKCNRVSLEQTDREYCQKRNLTSWFIQTDGSVARGSGGAQNGEDDEETHLDVFCC